MLTTQRALRERRVLDAVANYRAARSVWLIEGCFGAEGISAEDEFLELHAIFFTDLSEVFAWNLTDSDLSLCHYHSGSWLFCLNFEENCLGIMHRLEESLSASHFNLIRHFHY